MRLGLVQIARVGPLRDRTLALQPGLNVVYGPNEAGKTALVDFLVSQLFRREGRRGARLATVMRGVDRFAETRRGQVALHLDGEVLTYPGAPSLLSELGLGYSGLSGLFCVRSGEMDWPEKEEGEFWAALKKLLSGLPEGVETLRREAHAVGGLTETGQRMNREGRPLLDRYREAREREETLDELRALLPDARQREETIARLERELDALDRARQARIVELREKLEAAREELDELGEVPPRRLERWQELSVRADGLEERIEQLEGRLGEAREGRRDASEALAEARERAREAVRRRDALEERCLAQRADDYLADVHAEGEPVTEPRPADGPPSGGADAPGGSGRDQAGRTARHVAIAAVLVAAALGAAALADLIPPIVGTLGAVAGAAVAVWLGLRHRRARRRAAARRERREALLREAAAVELGAESVSEIPASVERSRREAAAAEQRLELLRVEAGHAEERVAELREELETARSELGDLREEMESLARELEADSLAEARARSDRRSDVEGRIRTIESALSELAGSEAGDRDASAPEDAGELPEWDAQRRARLERELEETRRRYRDLRDRFVEAGLATPEDALTEIEECRRIMGELDRDWQAARLAGAIFARMDESLEHRLTEVLESEGPLSAGAVIHDVTGRYVSISRREDEGLAVRDGEGRRFPVAQLSRGTRDQVYLALRIALGRAALDSAGLGEEGFFLLDDPFLTADWARRERLVDAAARLAEAGWQLVYLTCDDHLRELFVEAGGALHELT